MSRKTRIELEAEISELTAAMEDIACDLGSSYEHSETREECCKDMLIARDALYAAIPDRYAYWRRK